MEKITAVKVEQEAKVSEKTPLRMSFKRTASTIEHLDDSKRGNLINSLRKSSTNMISVSMKKYDAEELKVMKEYMRNETFVVEDKPEGFEEYYIEKNFIGEGTSSVVKRCQDKKTGKEFAVKIMRTNEVEKINQSKNEFYNLKFLHSDVIVIAYELFYNPSKGRICTVLEYDPELESVTNLIQKDGFMSEGNARNIFKQLIKGILTLHKNGICHRDLKPDNILTNTEGSKLKIIDFNVSKKKNVSYDKHSKKNMSMLTHIGTIDFSAPEIIEGYSEYSEQVDLWAAGSVLFYMLAGEPPFTGGNVKEIVDKISKGDCLMDSVIWDFISDEAKDLITNLLQVDPNKRLSAYEALHHPWLDYFNPLGDNCLVFNPKSLSTKNYHTHHNQQKVFNFDSELLEQSTFNDLTISRKEDKINSKNSIYQANMNFQTNSTNYFSIREPCKFRSRSSNNGARCIYK